MIKFIFTIYYFEHSRDINYEVNMIRKIVAVQY